MNDRQRQTEFLRRCVLYDSSQESQTLAARVRELQHKERCVGRWVLLMIVTGALAAAGLAYMAVFMEEFPGNIPGFMARFIPKAFCVMGLSSLICAPAFVGLGWLYRHEQAQVREECRQRTVKLLESRLPRPDEKANPEIFVEQARPAVWTRNTSDEGPAEAMPEL